MVALDRYNTFVYKPDELGIDDIFYDNVHYRKKVLTKIAEFIHSEII